MRTFKVSTKPGQGLRADIRRSQYAIACRLNFPIIQGQLDIVQRVAEFKAEQRRIFSDYNRGENVHDIVVRLGGDVVRFEQLPEIALARIVRHVANAPANVIRAPVVGCDNEQTRGLRLLTVNVAQVSRRSMCRQISPEPIVIGVVDR